MKGRLWIIVCLLLALVIPTSQNARASEGIVNPPEITISAGLNHTCFVTDAIVAGGVMCWGDNFVGQVGHDTTIPNYFTPVEVVEESGSTQPLGGVQSVAAGWLHTCALLNTGKVKCWGYNNRGQLGDGTNMTRYAPVDVVGLAGTVRSIAAGWNYTCALLDSGSVQCWGANDYGKLGNGNSDDQWMPTDVLLGEDASTIVAGENHACAVLASGGVKCWGSDAYGQLGNGFPISDSNLPVFVSGLTDVTAIAAGFLHNCAVGTGNTVACWGRNEYGELGMDPFAVQFSPSPISVYDETNVLLTNVRTVAGGLSYSCAVTFDKAILCWGNNLHGELGNGTWQNSPLAIPIEGSNFGYEALASGQNHSCAINNGGGVWCWGANYNGQLGRPTPPYESNVPICVPDFCSDPIPEPDQIIQSMINDQIQPLIDSGALNQGQGNALIAKLNAALEKLSQGNTNAVINLLQAFINQVEGLKKQGTLSPQESQTLIKAANQVIDTLDG